MAIARRCSPLVQIVGVAVLILVLARPLVFDGFQRGADFWVHYWYVWHQGEAVRDGGPSLYLHDSGSVFTPRYAFYGGTLYAITGALGVVVGSMLHAYVATYLLGCAAAYGGWWWLGRQAGLSRLVAHAPALVFATAAYSITLLNPRGDWPEHIGVSVVPLLAASALSVLRADRLRLLPALALMVSTVLFFGSHNLTLLCGTTLLLTLTALTLLCVPQARRMATRRGLLRVAAVLVPALLVNAWFLLPDLIYHSHAFVARPDMVDLWHTWLRQFGYLVATPRLLALSRPSDPVAAGYGVYALPVPAAGWAVVAAVASHPRLRQPWLRMFLVLAAMTAGLLVAMSHVGLLIGPFTMLQYAFRLESDVNLMIAGAVLAALVLLKDQPQRTRRVLHSVLAAILAVSVAQAAKQVTVRRDASKNVDLTAFPRYYGPKGLTHAQDYGSGDLPSLDSTGTPLLEFPVKDIRDGSVSGTLNVRGGERFVTNLVSLSQFVHLKGAHAVGIEPFGGTVIVIDPVSGPGPATISVSEAHPPAVVIGRWLSLLGLAGLAANLVVIAARGWRRRRSRRAPSTADQRRFAEVS